ncbi:MAG: RNA polymerase sigma factor, partial [Thermoanaerobaculia bacterium]|nr:RNA polymerase sigma factor [Thermoanaerobaculia bacterium]
MAKPIIKDADYLSDPDESALAAACCRGDSRAQRKLWERYKNRMYGVCLRFTATVEDAEDVLQEGFIQVFRDICQYRGEGSLEGWVRRIMVRTALQHLQKQETTLELIDLAVLEHLLLDEIKPGKIDEEPGRLVQILQKLPPGFRAVLNLYVIEERSHEEIARELGISVGTSKSQ